MPGSATHQTMPAMLATTPSIQEPAAVTAVPARRSGKRPCVIHVGKEGGLEVEQHETHLMHLAAVVLAGDAVAQLVIR